MRSIFLCLYSIGLIGCDNTIPPDTVHEAESNTEAAALLPPEGGDTAEPLPEEPVPDVNEEVDADGDGWFDGEDCDDLDDRINPGAPEFCDGIDTDCDGRIDPPDAVDAQYWYRDSDGDGYGMAWDWVPACTDPGEPWVLLDGDCDDSNDQVHPDAEEVCDGIDNDCDGLIDPDDSKGLKTWFFDSDGDGYGTEEVSLSACFGPDESWTTAGDDCDDADAEVFPGAVDICDEKDRDCDGELPIETAYFFPLSGEAVDLTGSLDSAILNIGEPGTLRFCEQSWSGQIHAHFEEEGALIVEGLGDVVLDAQGVGSVIGVGEGISTLEVKNLQLRGGSALRGGGIYAETANISLENMAFIGNEADEFGGAVFLQEGNIEMRSVEILENTSRGIALGGGGIYVGTGSVVVYDSIVQDNTAEGWLSSGGGIYVMFGEVLMQDVMVVSNTAPLHGGGVYVASGRLDMVNTRIEDNSAATGGGAYVGGDVMMSQSLFIDNYASDSGGGLFLNVADGEALLDCESIGVGAHGFMFNDSEMTGGAVQIASREFSSVSSERCDWGFGSSDNTGGDLRMAPFEAEAGSNAIFDCEGSDCVGDVEVVLAP